MYQFDGAPPKDFKYDFVMEPVISWRSMTKESPVVARVTSLPPTEEWTNAPVDGEVYSGSSAARLPLVTPPPEEEWGNAAADEVVHSGGSAARLPLITPPPPGQSQPCFTDPVQYPPGTELEMVFDRLPSKSQRRRAVVCFGEHPRVSGTAKVFDSSGRAHACVVQSKHNHRGNEPHDVILLAGIPEHEPGTKIKCLIREQVPAHQAPPKHRKNSNKETVRVGSVQQETVEDSS